VFARSFHGGNKNWSSGPFFLEKNFQTLAAIVADFGKYNRNMLQIFRFRKALDRFTLGNYEGIEVRSAADWLMQ
jgi:hypothetical protein